MHEEKFFRPTNPAQYISQLKNDYDHAMLANRRVMTQERIMKALRWIPLKLNCIKLNTDGACKKRIT